MSEYDFESQSAKYRIRVASGADFGTEMAAILSFLIPRAHVSGKYLRRYVPHVQILAVADVTGEIVSVCALKSANPEHTASIARDSGYPLAMDLPELGYAATHEQHAARGLGKGLNAEIVSRTEGAAYATVRNGNFWEERNLRRCHFHRVGELWERAGADGEPYAIGLWIRDADAPRNCDGLPDEEP